MKHLQPTSTENFSGNRLRLQAADMPAPPPPITQMRLAEPAPRAVATIGRRRRRRYNKQDDYANRAAPCPISLLGLSSLPCRRRREHSSAFTHTQLFILQPACRRQRMRCMSFFNSTLRPDSLLCAGGVVIWAHA